MYLFPALARGVSTRRVGSIRAATCFVLYDRYESHWCKLYVASTVKGGGHYWARRDSAKGSSQRFLERGFMRMKVSLTVQCARMSPLLAPRPTYDIRFLIATARGRSTHFPVDQSNTTQHSTTGTTR
jgi:hypothetical protein